MNRLAAPFLAAAVLCGCHSGQPAGFIPGDSAERRPYAGIGAADTVRFAGTEPFWGGSVSGEQLRYTTLESPAGEVVRVTRFAGRGGVSWAGTLAGARFALAVTPGECSDGMSDRRYPFNATIEVRGEQRTGCAWTEPAA